MRCPDCGVEVTEDMSFCTSCGKQLRDAPFVSSHRMDGSPYGPVMAEKKDRTWLIIAIVVVLVVVLPIVLSAVLYVMVLGFGDGEENTPAATYYDTSVPSGREVTILSISRAEVTWSDVIIQMESGTDFWNWEPIKAGLTGLPGMSQNCSGFVADGLTVWCTVVDLAGDGYVSGSDYFVLSGEFVDGAVYESYLVYEPTGAKIGTGTTWAS